MADQLMFGGCDMPSSSFKLNWAFGHSWPGENAHARVGGSLAHQKAGTACSCVTNLKFLLKEADAVGTTLEKKILALASTLESKFQTKIVRVCDLGAYYLSVA